MAEVRRTLQGKFRIAPERIAHLESKLREHFADAWVEGFESLIQEMTNDEKDRHVMAAAVHADARLIVTYNIRHFPLSSTRPWGVTAVGPSAFLKELYAADRRLVLEVLREQASDLKRSFADLLRVLHKAVPSFVEVVCRDSQLKL